MPTLITASGGRIELEANRSYLLGRGLDCDLVVEDIASSRHHARIHIGRYRQVMSIEDLGSRNGTYVDGERISGRTGLDDGATIRIGATVYRLRTADPEAQQQEEELLDTGTVTLERLSFGKDVDEEIVRVVKRKGQSGSDIAGQLGAFSLIEVLQILMQTTRSGTLHVALEGGHGSVEVRKGEILSASYQELQGYPALLMLARADSGMFWLVDSALPVPRSIHTPASRLLLELCCSLDEERSD